MTKQEAIKILISDFENNCIASEWKYLDDPDREICKALKIDKKLKQKDSK